MRIVPEHPTAAYVEVSTAAGAAYGRLHGPAPRSGRRLPGEVVLELRCKRRGHWLADVYKMRTGLLLLFYVDVPYETKAELAEAKADITRQLAEQGLTRADVGSIRGAALPVADMVDIHPSDDDAHPHWWFVCRCGERPAPSRQRVLAAAAGGERVLPC